MRVGGFGRVRFFSAWKFCIMAGMDCDNNSGEGPAVEAKIFSAMITPHRSLGPRGFLIFMLCLGGLSSVSGMIFVSLGAWPVMGFLGLTCCSSISRSGQIIVLRVPMRR